MNELYPHQLKALRKLANGKILCGKPGSGKSLVAATYYKEQEAPRDVYVITTAKKRDSRDWQDEFYGVGVGPKTGPISIPGYKRKDDGGGVRSQKSEDVHGSSSRRASANSGVVRGSTELRGDKVPLDDRERDVSSELHGRAGDTASDVRRGSGVLSQKEDQPREISGVDRSNEGSLGNIADEVRGSALSAKPFDEGQYPWVLTVDSWNNIAKYADVSGAFFIFDEQRLVGSGNWTRKFLRIAKRNHWILLSATPGDTWLDYVPVFVANNFYKNRTAFIREHVIYNNFTKFPKVDRYINVGRLVRQRHDLLVDMPFDSHTRRRLVEVPLPYDKELFERVVKDRWHVYEERPLRDVGEMFNVMRKVVNSDPSRLQMVRDLWEVHPKLIVFYNFNYELEALRSLKDPGEITTAGLDQISSARKLKTWTESSTTHLSTPGISPSPKKILTAGLRTLTGSKTSSINTRSTVGLLEKPRLQNEPFLDVRTAVDLGVRKTSTRSVQQLGSPAESAIAEWNGHKHQPIPSTTRWLYLVQYTAGAEGWNCTETDAMIMYSRNYSWKVTEQSYGRIDRLNTPFMDLWYYIFMSNSFIDQAIGRSLQAKETFNEAKYKKLFKD